MFSFSQFELMNEIDRDHLKILDHGHIDHDNQHTFEIEDLKKLILKTSKDLEEADRARREEFKVIYSTNKTDFILNLVHFLPCSNMNYKKNSKNKRN